MGLFETIINLPPTVIATWGYLLILVLGTFEATPFFGFLSPGLVAVAAGGFLAKLGILDIWGVLFWAVIAAILGDLLSYILGKKYGHELLTKAIKKYGKYVFIKESHYDKTLSMLEEHPGKTLIIGRFNSITRSFAAFVAGCTDIKLPEFTLYNITGGFLWAGTYTALGYLFGESYQLISGYINNTILALIAILIIYLYFKHKKSKEYNSGKEEKEL